MPTMYEFLEYVQMQFCIESEFEKMDRFFLHYRFPYYNQKCHAIAEASNIEKYFVIYLKMNT